MKALMQIIEIVLGRNCAKPLFVNVLPTHNDDTSDLSLELSLPLAPETGHVKTSGFPLISYVQWLSSIGISHLKTSILIQK